MENEIQQALEAYRMKRVARIRNGKKEVKRIKQYDIPCKPGYKRDQDTGRCVRMSQDEKRNRKRAAKALKRQKHAIARKRAKSLRRRQSLIR